MEKMDSEPLKDDFYDMASNMKKHFSWKVALVFFFIYMLVHSDLFVENVLVSELLRDKSDPTDLGIIVQGIIMVFAYIGLSLAKDSL
jgi:hypothetical protein